MRRLERDDRSSRGAYGIAILAACCVLTKHDFWAPAGYIMFVDLLRTRRVAPSVLSAILTAAGFSIVIASVGWHTFVAMLGGFNHVRTSPGKGFPSWERLTIECLVLALIALCVFALAGIARRRRYTMPLIAAVMMVAATSALHMWQTVHTLPAPPNELATPTQIVVHDALRDGVPLSRIAFANMRQRAGTTPLPVLLPFVLLALMALRWRTLPVDRRVTVAILLGLCMALRLRRAFEASEWHEFLFSLPVYIVAVEMLLRLDGEPLRRFRISMASILPLLALWANYEHGRGPLTARYYRARYETPRGTVRWAPQQAADFDRIRTAVDSIDPSGERPLLAFGFTGGWNYFLNRRNPFPFTQDFFFSAFDADSVLCTRPPRIFLINDTFIEELSFPAKGHFWSQWEQSRAPAPYGYFDRPRFNRLLQGCAEVSKASSRFHLYDCP